MSFQADPSPADILELPSTWLARFLQHVASGAGGLANAAALSQTCKSFHALADSSAVTYRDIRLENPLHSLAHPFFGWLEKRQGRVTGLTAELQLSAAFDPEPEAEQLQVMFGIPGLHLTVRCDDQIFFPDDPFITEVLRPYGHLIDHLISVVCIHGERLRLQDFCVTAAPCRSLGLKVDNSSEEPLNMGAFNSVANSLVQLDLINRGGFSNELESLSSLSSLSQLTLLSLDDFDFRAEEPWVHLVGLTNLKQLSLRVAASGDVSALSALTGLSSLIFHSYAVHDGLPSSCTFSSLQPLSTLQGLEELVLWDNACTATSLHGLAGLSMLKLLKLDAPLLKSLEGVSTGLTSLVLIGAAQLDSLAGVEQLQGLQNLNAVSCGVTSLQPLACLGNLMDLHIGGSFTCLAGLEGKLCTSLHSLKLESCRQLRHLSGIEGLIALQQLMVSMCGVTSLQPVGRLVGGLKKLEVCSCVKVQERVLELPNVQPTADVRIFGSNVKEVVLAGGVTRRQYA